MKVDKGNISDIFSGGNQFIVPVYQRTYSWVDSHYKRLWKDIVSLHKTKKSAHFIGSVVIISEPPTPMSVSKYVIIDGQQRMTTLILLLLALCDYASTMESYDGINIEMIKDLYIKNKSMKDPESIYKLMLGDTDKDVLIKLIEHSPIDNAASSRLKKAYDFFAARIAEGELNPCEIYTAIWKLQLVCITLDKKENDDPQMIFESLNSTGLDLSQSDLIRNYVLMGIPTEEQNYIYKNLWLPMETLFEYKYQATLMDKYFRDYISMKNAKIPNMDKVYEEFKEFHEREQLTIRVLCEDLYKYAKCYTEIINYESTDNELNKVFKDITEIQIEVSYPFLLKVYGYYKEGKINRDEFIEILKMTENYIVRRSICEIPTNSLNKTFVTMWNNINEEDSLRSLKAAFLLLKSYKRFPDDDEFTKALLLKDIYNIRHGFRSYLFGKFENFEKKGPININNYTIEHIMPKTLSAEWKNELGREWQLIHNNYLDTIGNLTLTAYNSEMSNKTFDQKLEMDGGFKQSALKINSYVVKQTTWNQDKIVDRANEMCALAKTIWYAPKLNEAELCHYAETTKQEDEPIDYPEIVVAKKKHKENWNGENNITYKNRYLFFEQFLSVCNKDTDIYKRISPVGYQNWINAATGKDGLTWVMHAFKKTSRVELFIHKSGYSIVKNRFDILYSNKEKIEKEYGEPLRWSFDPARKQQYIMSYCPLGGLDDMEQWPDIQKDLVDRQVRLEKAIGPYLKSL